MAVLVPPIKSQGIKVKLIPAIKRLLAASGRQPVCWVEPFMGTGSVGLNIAAKSYFFSDSNPHLIGFYSDLKQGKISAFLVRQHLINEGANLQRNGADHYYAIRERFNNSHNPLDFIFLNRAAFNGMIRFSRSGKYNVPFCKKDNRFSKAYITKIYNQTLQMENFLRINDVSLICQDFRKALLNIPEHSMVYCDPPYIFRNNDYFNGWTEKDELNLNSILKNSGLNFILSTWHHNKYRSNSAIAKIWNCLNMIEIEHFYHLGANESNRHSVVEALIYNFGDSYKINFPEKSIHLNLI